MPPDPAKAHASPLTDIRALVPAEARPGYFLGGMIM